MTTTVVGEHWAPASPRTAWIFVGVRSAECTVDQSHPRWPPLAVVGAADRPLHTPPGASVDYNLLVERFLRTPKGQINF